MPVGATTSTIAGTVRRRRLSSNRSDGAVADGAAATAIPTTQEAEALFQSLTVAEMKEKRKEYNSGVEAKRQELRMLVGKRLVMKGEKLDSVPVSYLKLT